MELCFIFQRKSRHISPVKEARQIVKKILTRKTKHIKTKKARASALSFAGAQHKIASFYYCIISTSVLLNIVAQHADDNRDKVDRLTKFCTDGEVDYIISQPHR